MAFCLADLYLWSCRNSLHVQDTDIGTFRFYEKGELVFPTDQHYFSEKQRFVESRGNPCLLRKHRTERLGDALKELEELLQSNSCVCTKWRTKQCCQMLLSSGVMVTLSLSGAQLERVAIDKTLVGRLPADTISHAVIGERFLLLSLVEKSQVCQVYLRRRSQSSPEASARRFEKLSPSEIKVSWVELPGGGGRRAGRRVGLNRAQDVGVCWWRGGREEVWPWSPVPSPAEQANLVLLSCSDSPGLSVLSSIRTDGDPLNCCFSLTQPYQVLMLELREAVTRSCVYECARGRLQQLSAVPVPVSSAPVSWCRDPSERLLLLGLQDGSVVLFHREMGTVGRATCPMLPLLLAWHPAGGLVVAAGGQGELQCFDLGLSPLPMRLLSEEQAPGLAGPTLQLARHVKAAGGLAGIEWAHSPVSQGAERPEVHDLLLLRFHEGPLAALKLKMGVMNGAHITAGELLQQRLHCGEVGAALGILGNMDWCMMGPECYRGLISVTDHLLRKPLDEETEGQLEAALGVFYSPSRSLTDTIILEYRDPISRYTRRFFHHLLRHQRFEKAFLLALDIGARDLFMDLHFVAADCGESALAATAERKAQELDALEVANSDPDEPKAVERSVWGGVYVSPTADIPLHRAKPTHTLTSAASSVESTDDVRRRRKEHLTDTLPNPPTWPWNQTESSQVSCEDQASENGNKLKVIHFGVV